MQVHKYVNIEDIDCFARTVVGKGYANIKSESIDVKSVNKSKPKSSFLLLATGNKYISQTSQRNSNQAVAVAAIIIKIKLSSCCVCVCFS